MLNNKKKIALICDVRNWAFSNIALEVKNNLKDDFNIDIFYANEDYENIYDLCGDTILKEYDIVHFFWRLQIYEIFNPKVLRSCPIPISNLIESFAKKTITTSVYDHAFITKKERKYYKKLFSLLCDAYTVSSHKLLDIYKIIKGYKLPSCVIQDGVNLKLFYPKNINRFENRKNNDCLKIGWVGNSKWSLKKNSDNKGLNTIIKPAVKNLKRQGFEILEIFADRNQKLIPIEEMVDYYSEIDVLICASDIEGTPNPVLEAMASGVPVISTNVGIVPEIFGPKQKKFIYRRSINGLSSKITELIRKPSLLKVLSEENLSRISQHTRQVEAKKWRHFFIKSLVDNQNKDIAKKVSEIAEHIYQQQESELRDTLSKLRIKFIFAKKILFGLFITKI